MNHSSSIHGPNTQFATLEPRIRHVSQKIIRKRWKKLSADTQKDVRDIFSALRQTYKGSKDGNRRNLSGPEESINKVTDKLVERLPRMPFPPSAHDETFDFELTLHRIRQGEEQLTANLHSMNLLRAQIKREERLLEQDRHEAALLERNLKASEASRNQRAKALHTVAHNISSFTPDIGEMRNSDTGTRRREESRCPISVTTLISDPDVRPLLGQLRNHLHSIQNNANSVHAVAEAINDTGHALSGLWASSHGQGQATIN